MDVALILLSICKIVSSLLILFIRIYSSVSSQDIVSKIIISIFPDCYMNLLEFLFFLHFLQFPDFHIIANFNNNIPLF